MNTYNEDILRIIPEFVNRIIDSLNKTNDNGIINVDYNVAGTVDTSISNYLSHGSDSYFLFNYEYEFKGEKFSFELKVPKQVAGVFVVNGKVAIPYMELVTDFRMKVHKGVLKIDNKRTVSIDKYGNYILEVDGLSFNLSDPNAASEIPTEYVELDDDLIKIAQAKVIYKPKFIDVELCKALFHEGEFQGKMSDITDITIKSTATYVRTKLNKDFRTFISPIRYRFKGGNRSKIGQIQVSDINKAIIKYFSTNEGKFNYFMNVTNPLTLQSLSSQVKVPHGNSFNASVFDLIDVVDTPINNNINKINYLNRNVRLTDGGIEIQVYTKDRKKIWLSKLDYCVKAILDSECWDYKRWDIAEEYKGKELKAKVGKYNISYDSFDDIDYIELEPNERTSVTSHVVPMINKSELGRMAMGTSMIKQGVNLINAEEPLVTTEDLSELIKLNPLIITAEDEGEVVSVTRTSVSVKGPKGTKDYRIPYALQSYTGNLVPFIAVVEEGQHVNQGEILISPNNLGKNAIKYGVNAVVAFNSYFGYNSDDAIVISESFANRIASVYTHRQMITIKNVESIKFIKKAGNMVTSGDVLVDYTVSHKKSKYGDMLNNEEVVENILHQTAMNNLVDAFIFEVIIKIGSQVVLNEESFDVIDQVNQDIDLGEFKNEVPLLPQTDFEANPNEVKIEFSFLMKRKAFEGDKLTNRYGNKGIISKIVPDSQMIRTEDGLVADVCFSRESLPARKNISQIYELYLGQISKQIKDLWNKSDEDKIKAVGVYNTLFKTTFSVDEFAEEVRRLGDVAFASKVGSYSRIEADEVIDAINELGIKIKNTAYIGRRKVSSDVLFGPMYIIKLPYLPENTLAITTSKKLIGVNAPILGSGKPRGEGQKFGEMESTATAVNSPELLDYYKSIGGVTGNISRLYFDFLDVGLDISGIATSIVTHRNEITDDKLKELQDHFNG